MNGNPTLIEVYAAWAKAWRRSSSPDRARAAWQFMTKHHPDMVSSSAQYNHISKQIALHSEEKEVFENIRHLADYGGSKSLELHKLFEEGPFTDEVSIDGKVPIKAMAQSIQRSIAKDALSALERKLRHLAFFDFDKMPADAIWFFLNGLPVPYFGKQLHLKLHETTNNAVEHNIVLGLPLSEKEQKSLEADPYHFKLEMEPAYVLRSFDGYARLFNSKKGFVGHQDFARLSKAWTSDKTDCFYGLRKDEFDKNEFDDLYFIYDLEGNKICEIKAEAPRKGHRGHLLTSKMVDGERHYALIKNSGEFVTSFDFVEVSVGWVRNLTLKNKAGKWVLWNEDAEEYLPYEFDEDPNNLSVNQLKIVSVNGKFGILDRENNFEILLPFEFDYIDYKSRIYGGDKEFLVCKHQNDTYAVFNIDGSPVFTGLKYLEIALGVESDFQIISPKYENEKYDEEFHWNTDLDRMARNILKQEIRHQTGNLDLSGASLAPLANVIEDNRKADAILGAYRIWRAEVALIEDIQGFGEIIPKGRIGRIGTGDYGYAMGGMFNYAHEVPVHSIKSGGIDKTIGIPFEKLRLIKDKSDWRFWEYFEQFNSDKSIKYWCLRFGNTIYGPYRDYRDVYNLIREKHDDNDRMSFLNMIWHSGMKVGWEHIFSFYTELPVPTLARESFLAPIPKIRFEKIVNKKELGKHGARDFVNSNSPPNSVDKIKNALLVANWLTYILAMIVFAFGVVFSPSFFEGAFQFTLWILATGILLMLIFKLLE